VINLWIKRADAGAAAAGVDAAIREEVPTAVDVTTRVEGQIEDRSWSRAAKAEMAGYFSNRFRTAFAVIADARTPRPVRISCGWVAVGRGAVVGTIQYETRLRRTVPGTATLRRGWLRSGVVDADPGLREVLTAAAPLRREIGRFLRPSLFIGNAALKIKPLLVVVPDDDGALVVALAMPLKTRYGFGRSILDLVTFLDIADGLEAALAHLPGSVAIPTALSPLPEVPAA
jgi:hypothetical protein